MLCFYIYIYIHIILWGLTCVGCVGFVGLVGFVGFGGFVDGGFLWTLWVRVLMVTY